MPADATPIDTDPDYREPSGIAQACRVGDLIITSGQAALDRTGKLAGVGDFAIALADRQLLG